MIELNNGNYTIGEISAIALCAKYDTPIVCIRYFSYGNKVL